MQEKQQMSFLSLGMTQLRIKPVYQFAGEENALANYQGHCKSNLSLKQLTFTFRCTAAENFYTPVFHCCRR